MKLEELLNKLIQRWWKPFGRETRHELSSWVVYDTIDIKWKWDIRVIDRRHHHIRELVSKESGLWQFCCDNELIKGNTKEAYYWQYKTPLWAEWSKTYRKAHYQHRIIESALCNEEDLEQFLLDNIKIDE